MYKPKIILYTKCESTSAARKVLPAHIQNQSLTAPHGKPRQHHSTASCSRFGITTPARAFLRGRQLRSRANVRVRHSRTICPLGQISSHYTTKRKCLLARAFLRGRQWEPPRECAVRAFALMFCPQTKQLRTLYHHYMNKSSFLWSALPEAPARQAKSAHIYLYIRRKT